MAAMTKACVCPACTAPVAENEDSAVLIYDEQTLEVHILVNYHTDRATWDVATCGVTVDIDSDHLRVRDEVRLKDWCRDCVVNFAKFLNR